MKAFDMLSNLKNNFSDFTNDTTVGIKSGKPFSMKPSFRYNVINDDTGEVISKEDSKPFAYSDIEIITSRKNTEGKYEDSTLKAFAINIKLDTSTKDNTHTTTMVFRNTSLLEIFTAWSDNVQNGTRMESMPKAVYRICKENNLEGNKFVSWLKDGKTSLEFAQYKRDNSKRLNFISKDYYLTDKAKSEPVAVESM